MSDRSAFLCVRVFAGVRVCVRSHCCTLQPTSVSGEQFLLVQADSPGWTQRGKLMVESFQSSAVKIFENFTDTLRVLPAPNLDDFHHLSNQVVV